MELTYNLITRRCSTVPRLRYVDTPEMLRITLAGRAVRPAFRWRAAISTSRSVDDACVVARINEGISVTGSTLTVPADVFFTTFRDAVARHPDGRKMFLAVYGLDERDHTVEYIEFRVEGLPAIDPPDGPPKTLPDRPGGVYLTRDEIVALIEEHAAGPLAIVADPVTEMPVYDEKWGNCRYLDETFRHLRFASRVCNLRAVGLEVVSCNAAITGNIVLRAVMDGIEQPEQIIVPVGAKPAVVEFPLEMTGELALVRDCADEADTLKDGGAVTAIVLNVYLKVDYA